MRKQSSFDDEVTSSIFCRNASPKSALIKVPPCDPTMFFFFFAKNIFPAAKHCIDQHWVSYT